jgi:glycosyltransferase involved in cell wall biosynthesis
MARKHRNATPYIATSRMIEEIMHRPKIFHMIGSLEVGGAEKMLCVLLSLVDHSQAEHHVVTMVPGGAFESEIKSLGVPIHCLGMRRGVPNPAGLLRMVRLLKEHRPQLLDTWMYHSNFLGSIAARMAGDIPVIWNIHNAGIGVSSFKPSTRLITSLTNMLAPRWALRTVFVSQASQQNHRNYPKDRSLLIPNGFDTSRFYPNPACRMEVRKELGLPGDTRLVGIAARLHPDKDHKNFVSAAAQVYAANPKSRFIICGEGPNAEKLPEWLCQAGISNVAFYLGRRLDMPRISASLDVAVLSSYSEAFPIIIGEAMSCGVPCVVTDTGDSAYMVGNTGRVVPPKNSDSLANAILELLDLPIDALRELGNQARRRILDNFTIETIAPRYQKLWLNAAQSDGAQIRRAA